MGLEHGKSESRSHLVGRAPDQVTLSVQFQWIEDLHYSARIGGNGGAACRQVGSGDQALFHCRPDSDG
jgi:hypothetical protein